MTVPFSIISIVGRSGSGKGTQAELLSKKTGFRIIATGDLLRKRAEKKDEVGRIVKQTLEKGGLIPTPIVFSLWMPLIAGIKNKGKAKGIILDGNPRKMYEAQMLDELFSMLGWENRFRVCFINISEKEAMRRLFARGRHDDIRKQVAERMAFFKSEVDPMLTYYKKRGTLIEIDGTQSPENVHQEIMKKLQNFF